MALRRNRHCSSVGRMAASHISILVPRAALYSILTAMEEDVRLLLVSHLEASSPTVVLGDDLFARAVERARRDLGEAPHTIVNLLPYVDFGDVWGLVNRHADLLPPAWAAASKRYSRRIARMSAIRNRVMHSRPLDFDDLPIAMEFAAMLADDDTLSLPRLREAMTLLEANPAGILDTGFPEHSVREAHNLPFPDFDETGFVGRRDVIEHIKTLCLGPYPVITIVGDGGLGKTAAAIKVAYELLDDERSPFEATIWSTSKTTQLTARDILNIEGAISSSLGLMEDIASELGGSGSESEAMDEVLEYLAQFKILLIMDNLETVLDDRIRSFLTRLPVGSKILITSRIGLGSFEHPVRLPKLSAEQAVQMIRALAHVRGVGDLLRMDNAKVATYCQRMDNNPLWIKWFVSGVQAGVRPGDLLANPDRFLEFSMSNVYEYLSARSREVLQAMQVVPGKKSQPELAYITGLNVDELQSAVAELSATNMVVMASTSTGSSFETHYELAELPRTYLAKRHPVDQRVYTELTAKHRELQAQGQDLREAQRLNPYLVRSLDLRSAGNLVVAKHLLDALSAASDNNFARAEEELATARRLAPEWYEVHRVEALVKAREGNATGAQEAFEGAIDLEPESAPLRLRYGMFKLDFLNDAAAATEELQRAREIDPNSLDVRLELVRAYQRDVDFESARVHLNHLLDNQSRLPRARLSMLWDLELQQWMRLARRLSMEGKHERAARALQSLRRAYYRVPHTLRDAKIRGRLTQALPTARRVAKYSRDGHEAARVREFITWVEAGGLLGEEAALAQSPQERRRGTVVTLHSDRGFGFIRLGDGDEVFLHFSQLEFDQADLVIGDELFFNLVPGQDGRLRAMKAARV